MKLKLILAFVAFIPTFVMAEAPKIEIAPKIEVVPFSERPSPFKIPKDGGISVSPPRGNVDQIPDVIVTKGKGNEGVLEVQNGDVPK